MPSHGIFRLQNAAELQEAEELYLPKGAENTCAIVLAASRGDELGELTEHQPKTMVKIQGTPILSHIVDAYNAVGIKDIVVVRGYKKEAVNLPNLNYVDNNDFADTGKLDSLLKALRSRKGHVQSTIISYGDVLFNKYIPQSLCQENDDYVIFVDSHWHEQTSYTRLGGFTECSFPNSRNAFNARSISSSWGGMDGISLSLAQRSRPHHRYHCGHAGPAGQPQSRHVPAAPRTVETGVLRPRSVYGRALA